MRNRTQFLYSCSQLLWQLPRSVAMIRVPLFLVLFTGFLVIGCVQRDTDDKQLPAAKIPVHVLNKNDTGRTLVVEPGDWVEIELPITEGPAVWKPRIEGSIEFVKSNDIVSRNTEAGPVQVFRFRTSSAGSAKVSFELVRPAAGATPEQVLSFSIDIR